MSEKSPPILRNSRTRFNRDHISEKHLHQTQSRLRQKILLETTCLKFKKVETKCLKTKSLKTFCLKTSCDLRQNLRQ